MSEGKKVCGGQVLRAEAAARRNASKPLILHLTKAQTRASPASQGVTVSHSTPTALWICMDSLLLVKLAPVLVLPQTSRGAQ